MKHRILKFTLIIVVASLVAACSQTSQQMTEPTQPESVQAQKLPANPEPSRVLEEDFRAKYDRWAATVEVKFPGQEDLQGLTEVNGRGCCQTPQDFAAYYHILDIQDSVTSGSFELLRRANARFFQAFECLKFGAASSGQACPVKRDMSFDETQLRELQASLAEITALAKLIRERIFTTAAILDFKLPSAALASQVESDFAAQINVTVDAVLQRNPELAASGENFRADASLLRAVSLNFENGESVSFFKFLPGDGTQAELRGEKEIVEAGGNRIIPVVLLNPNPPTTFHGPLVP